MKKIIFFVIASVSFSAFSSAKLSFKDSQLVRSWMVRIISEQIRQGPSPKWGQRDCVGLVDYAFSESIKRKSEKWYSSHGFSDSPTPPDLELSEDERVHFLKWKRNDGSREDGFISAINLIQKNTAFVGKELSQARPGDLLFFDMGDSQHLMVWMGSFLAYHTGTVTKHDNGLRKYHLKTLLQWKDSRWRPKVDNPNFIGLFRLSVFSY